MQSKKLFLSLTALCLVAAATSARADTLFQLNDSACSSGCSVIPAGTVALTQNGANNVLVTVQLTSDYSFRKAPDQNHWAFVFNLSNLGGATVTVDPTSISSSIFAFQPTGTTYKAAGLGNFEYAFQDVDPAKHPASISSFSFDVTATGLVVADFTSNGSDYFGVDVTGLDAAAGVGKTGNIGAKNAGVPSNTNPPPPVVPEPSTFALLGTGLIGAAGLVRRRSSVR